MFNKVIYSLLLIALTLTMLPQRAIAQDGTGAATELYLPFIAKNYETHNVTVKAGSFVVGPSAASTNACSFERAPEVSSASASTNGICPPANTYVGLEIIADGTSEVLVLPWEETQTGNPALFLGQGSVTNIDEIAPDSLTISTTHPLPIVGPVQTQRDVRIVKIELSTDVLAAAVANDPGWFEMLNFHTKLDRFIAQWSDVFVVDTPSIVPFWDIPTGLTTKFITQCGYISGANARWVPYQTRMRGAPPRFRMFVEGVFLGDRPDSPGVKVNTCMHPHRMILTADLITQPYAAPLRQAIIDAVGDWRANPFKVWSPEWDPELVYTATWVTIESGLGAYVVYETVKGTLRGATMFFVVPQQFLECPLVTPEISCTINSIQ